MVEIENSHWQNCNMSGFCYDSVVFYVQNRVMMTDFYELAFIFPCKGCDFYTEDLVHRSG